MEIENQMEIRYGLSSSKVNKAVPKRNQTDDNDENISNPSNPSNPSESSNSTSSSNSSSSSDSTEELGSEQRPISVQTERKRNKKIKALLESVINDDSYLDPMYLMKNLYRMMNEVKFLKIQAMTKTLLMNSLQLPIGMILTIMVILHILIQVLSFLNLGYYYGYININQGFAYLMLQ